MKFSTPYGPLYVEQGVAEQGVTLNEFLCSVDRAVERIKSADISQHGYEYDYSYLVGGIVVEPENFGYSATVYHVFSPGDVDGGRG